MLCSKSHLTILPCSRIKILFTKILIPITPSYLLYHEPRLTDWWVKPFTRICLLWADYMADTMVEEGEMWGLLLQRFSNLTGNWHMNQLLLSMLIY
jgi:hypothetical protein